MTQSIEKLQKRLEKDPNSLVFVQLAEEYRKEGNLEEAMRIVKVGLARHPNYWSARVTMGRIHHQMGNPEGAREELEKVVLAVPDHLLANRLLGDVYRELNLSNEALQRYRIVQMITPADQALNDQIELLESSVRQDAPVELEPEPILLPEVQTEPRHEEQNAPAAETETPAEVAIDEPEEEIYAPTIQIQIPEFLEKTEVPVAAIDQEAEAPAVVPEPVPEPMLASIPEPFPESISQSIPETSDKEPESVEQMQAEAAATLEEPLRETESAVLEPHLPDTLILEPASQPPEPQESEEQEDDFHDVRDSEELSSLANLLLSAEEPVLLDSPPFDELDSDYSRENEVPGRVRSTHQDRTQPIEEEVEGLEEAEELTTETLAELYLSQGLTDKALKVYQRLLLQDPGNPQLFKRLQELRGTSNMPEEMKSEAELEEEVVLVEDDVEQSPETYQDDLTIKRAEERRRKIHTLENWLSSIRRDQD